MGKLKFLLLAAIVAVIAIPDLRNKVLDQLFGSEEEFQYSGPDSTNA